MRAWALWAPVASGHSGYRVDVDTGAGHEEELTGGHASASVVRVGDTVRKPWLPTTERTVGYMTELRSRGVDVPRTHGRDEQGRLVLDWVPGELAIDRGPLDDACLCRVGALVRQIHDASIGLPVPADWEVLIPAGRPDLVCHNDLAAWNLVIDGQRLVFIDWDGAGPSTRQWDLAYAAISFGHAFPGQDPADVAGRLVAFLEGYGADHALRAALPRTMLCRARAMHDLLRRSHDVGRQPWGAMYAAGHGEHWRTTTDFLRRHQRSWRRVVS